VRHVTSNNIKYLMLTTGVVLILDEKLLFRSDQVFYLPKVNTQ